MTLTYFNESLNDGFRYSSYYAPREYKKYDASGINTNTLTAPPDLSTLPYTVRQVLRGYDFVTNGSRIDKQGVEFQLTTVRWKALRTALTITGAWFKSTYKNSQLLYETVSDVVDNEAISDRYVGLYDTNDGRVNEQFNTNFMFDTQVPRWGFIFTTTVQCMWYTKTTRLWENGTPVMYLSASDGELHEYTTSDASDYYLKYLVKTYNEANFLPQRVPLAMYINLKATKRIGKNLKIAMFVNRIIDYLPEYKSGSLTIRRASSPYFGMELNFNV